MDENMEIREYDDSLAGKFEEAVDKVTEIRRSVFEGVCESIKGVANSVTGKDADSEDYEPGPIAQVVDTVNGVDQAITEGIADIVKSVGKKVLGILG